MVGHLQVYRIGPRFKASVSRVDRRGSVDSALFPIVRVGGTPRQRVVRVGPAGYNVESRAAQIGQPQVNLVVYCSSDP